MQDPFEFFKCDHKNWPVCIFDFTYKSILPQYFAFTVKKESYIIIPDYFSFTTTNP